MSGKILVVEDLVIAGMDLVMMLEDLGYEAIGPIGNVTAALALLEYAPVSMAILDLNLGAELSSPIAAACRQRGIPFIAASAYGDLETIGGAAFKGIVNVGKPYELSIISEAVRAAAPSLTPAQAGGSRGGD